MELVFNRNWILTAFCVVWTDAASNSPGGDFFLFQTITHTHILSLSKIKDKQFYKIKQLVSNKGDLIYIANTRMFKIYYKLKKNLFFI